MLFTYVYIFAVRGQHLIWPPITLRILEWTWYLTFGLTYLKNGQHSALPLPVLLYCHFSATTPVLLRETIRNWKMRGKETTTTRGSLKCPSFTHGARTCPHCYNLQYCTAQHFRHTTTSSPLDKLLRKYVDSDSTGSEGYSMPQRSSSIKPGWGEW